MNEGSWRPKTGEVWHTKLSGVTPDHRLVVFGKIFTICQFAPLPSAFELCIQTVFLGLAQLHYLGTFLVGLQNVRN